MNRALIGFCAAFVGIGVLLYATSGPPKALELSTPNAPEAPGSDDDLRVSEMSLSRQAIQSEVVAEQLGVAEDPNVVKSVSIIVESEGQPIAGGFHAAMFDERNSVSAVRSFPSNEGSVAVEDVRLPGDKLAAIEVEPVENLRYHTGGVLEAGLRKALETGESIRVAVRLRPIGYTRLSGYVQTTDGTPLGGARVDVFSVADNRTPSVGHSYSAQDGSFSVPVHPYTHDLYLIAKASLGPGASKVVSILKRPNQDADLNTPLVVRSTSVTLSVVDTDGDPITQGDVVCADRGSWRKQLSLDGDPMTFVAPESFSVIVKSKAFTQMQIVQYVRVRHGDEMEVTVVPSEPDLTISVTYRGKPLENGAAQVWALSAPSLYSQNLRVRDGKFTVDRWPQGLVLGVVARRGLVNGASELLVLRPNDVRDQEITLEVKEAGYIKAHVSTEGDPSERIRVRVFGRDGAVRTHAFARLGEETALPSILFEEGMVLTAYSEGARSAAIPLTIDHVLGTESVQVSLVEMSRVAADVSSLIREQQSGVSRNYLKINDSMGCLTFPIQARSSVFVPYVAEGTTKIELLDWTGQVLGSYQGKLSDKGVKLRK